MFDWLSLDSLYVVNPNLLFVLYSEPLFAGSISEYNTGDLILGLDLLISLAFTFQLDMIFDYLQPADNLFLLAIFPQLAANTSMINYILYDSFILLNSMMVATPLLGIFSYLVALDQATSALLFDIHAIFTEFLITYFEQFSVTFITTLHGYQLPINIRTWYNIIYEMDCLLIISELFLLVVLLGTGLSFISQSVTTKTFYDDVITFCQTNNLSLSELGIFTSFFFGFIIFDIFLSFSEDDFSDFFFIFILVFVILLFFFFILGLDVQYYYLISNISNGDLTFRVIIFDFINNFLCILRIFFCWIRYIFYDLQVEFIDFVFHYSDTVNEVLITSFWNTANSGAWATNETYSYSSLLLIFKPLLFALTLIYVEIAVILVQILVGLFKFVIAFFLLWLIVDLFILKTLVNSESRLFTYLRQNI